VKTKLGNDLIGTARDSARSGFFLASGSIIGTIVMSIGAILCGRLLGPELYGQYTLALVGPQLFFLFTDMGINQGVIKLTANLRSKGENYRIPRIIYCGLILRITTGIALSTILFVFAEPFAAFLLNRPDLYPYLRIVSILILFQAIYATAYSAFVSIDKSEYSALTLNLEAIIKSGLSITLVIVGFSVLGALIGNIIGYAIAGICGVILLKTLLSKRHIVPQDTPNQTSHRENLKTEMKALVRYGIPIYGAFLFAGFIPVYQNMVLANFSTDVVIGNFKAASNFAVTMTLLSLPITTALLSGFSKLDSAEKQRRIFFKMANKFTTLLVFPFIALFVIFANEIVQILYGSTYQSAPLFLALYSLLYLLMGFGYLNLTSFYNGVGDTKMTLKIGLLTFIIVVVLSPLTAQSYGVPGLIAAFLFANAVGTFYGAHVAKRKYSLQFDIPSVAKICVVSIVSAVPALLLQYAGFPMHYTLLAGVLVYLFAYLTLIPFTRILGETELDTLKNIFHHIGPLRRIGNAAIRYEKKILSTSLSIKPEKD
jgi:O-antigen/teichoic acid export membrane protein